MHTQATFPRSPDNRAKSLCHLVHSDIWGPRRDNSTLGFKYFVTFIDDYSRCTWMLLMKDHSKIFSIFQTFCAEIKNWVSVSIRIFSSDNAREYLSCPYTAQQNGNAERKNRHIVGDCTHSSHTSKCRIAILGGRSDHLLLFN